MEELIQNAGLENILIESEFEQNNTSYISLGNNGVLLWKYCIITST
jgi:hypothetical protein